VHARSLGIENWSDKSNDDPLYARGFTMQSQGFDDGAWMMVALRVTPERRLLASLGLMQHRAVQSGGTIVR